MIRCVNIDWLEVYALESDYFPMEPTFWERYGWDVRVRSYGTRQYRQMFTLFDKHGQPFVEIRREPVSGEDATHTRGIFSPYSTHIKLCNRYCYLDDAMKIFCDFLADYHYQFQRIFRLDICLDFEKFDSGDDPSKFVQRYMAGKYSKVNQSKLAAHGIDRWDERRWNSLSWGNSRSMISTKLYNKSLELKEAHDKPYIRWAWFKAGIVDDYFNMTKHKNDGTVYTPDVWRLEFSIRSSAKGWFILEDESGRKKKQIALEHTLDTYATRDDLLHAFANLSQHYFHFKHFEPGRRKYDCQDKTLFDFSGHYDNVKLDKLPRQTESSVSYAYLIGLLERWKMSHFGDYDKCKAADTVILACQADQRLHATDGLMTERELEDLRIRLREATSGVDIDQAFREIWYYSD